MPTGSSSRVHDAQDRRLRRAGAAQPARRRSALAGRRRARARQRRRRADRRRAAARARREGFEKLCAFTHAPRYFIHMGFSIVPHLWLTEKMFTDCVKCPQFRQCGQYAMVVPLDVAFDAERGYDARRRRAHGDVRSATRRSRRRPIAGGVTTPRGFRAAGVSAGIKANGAPDLALLVVRRAGAGRRASSPPTRSQAAPVLVSQRAPRALGRHGARDRRQQRLRQRLHRRRRACATRASMAAKTARAGRLPGRAGAGRVDRRHRRQPADGQDPRAACRPRSRRSARDQGRGRGARDHDDRSVSEGSGGRGRDRRRRDARSAAWPRAPA